MKLFIFFLGLLLVAPIYGEKVWETTQGNFSVSITLEKNVLKSFENASISLELRHPPDYEVSADSLTNKLMQNNTALPPPFKLVSVETKKTQEGTTLNYELSPQWEGKFDLSFYAIDFVTRSSKNKGVPVTIISGIFPIQVKFEESIPRASFETAPLMNFSTKLPVEINYQNKKAIENQMLNEVERNNSLIENSQRLVKMLAALLFIGCFILLIKFNKVSSTIPQEKKIANARTKAMKSLEKIEMQNNEDKSPYHLLYAKLSEIVRIYLEDRYQLKAPQKTTQEFFADLNSENFPASIPREELEEFLSFSDQVKFAKLVPREKEFEQALQTAKSFVDRDGA